jgi:hypothetical protein
MRLMVGPSLLAAALLVGAGAAFFPHATTTGAAHAATFAPRPDETVTPGSEAFNAATPGSTALPPNHPPIGAAHDDTSAARDDAPALAWTAPAGWEATPSRSAMRLATYRVPTPSKGASGAELTVTRAGGSTQDNLDRWVGQFDPAGKDTRTARTIAGFRVTTLNVSGTYDGGMSGTGPEATHAGWALLGAVVETTGPFYFFKMVGPSDAVHAAKPAFDALIASFRTPS